MHTTRTRYGRNFGAHHCEGPAYHEPQKSIVRCLEYGTRCPQLAESQAAFRRNEAAVARVPVDRRLLAVNQYAVGDPYCLQTTTLLSKQMNV